MTNTWHTNHLLLAEKLVLHIDAEKQTTFDKLEARALKHGIAMNVFDRAIEKLHKLPNIKRTVKLGTVHYELQAVKAKPGPILSGDWVRANYPWPQVCTSCSGNLCSACFPFHDPEKDTVSKIRERLVMTRDEYKALSEGRTYIPKKRYEHTRR